MIQVPCGKPLMACEQKTIPHDLVRDRVSATPNPLADIPKCRLTKHITGKDRARLDIALLKKPRDIIPRKTGARSQGKRKCEPDRSRLRMRLRQNKEFFISRQKPPQLLKIFPALCDKSRQPL